jgi:hypothetical protein
VTLTEPAEATTVTIPKVLYHFTCLHSVPGITRTGRLRPWAHPLLPELGPVIWLTDLAAVDRPEVVGLDRVTLECDRTEFRFSVAADSPGVSWWPFVRDRCQPSVVADLEHLGWPSRWWVGTEPITILPGE